MSTLRILVVTGSSGGHIFPALAFLDTLTESKEIEAWCILPKRNSIGQLEGGRYGVRYISFSPLGLGRGIIQDLSTLYNLLKGILESLFIVVEFRPHVVVGFGSLYSVPLILFAWMFKMKTLIHEQNVIPGRANRFLLRFVDRIAVSFAETRHYCMHCSGSAVFTGNPIRRSLRKMDKHKARDFFGLKQDAFTVLVMGGSQGSRSINFGFLKAISGIEERDRIQIIHITGASDFDAVKSRYQDYTMNVTVLGFLDQMQYAYSAADLIITRGGATSIAEIMYFGLPAIIVPYPYAYEHQVRNAEVLKRKQAAFIINDEALGTDALRQTIAGLIRHPEEIAMMRSRYSDYAKIDSAALLKEAVLSLP